MTEKHPGTIPTSESIAPENTQPWPSRRKARATALEVLYETDCSRHDPEGILNYRLSDKPLQRPVEEHARKLVEKVLANKDSVHGVTIHYVDKTLDGGPICAQSEMVVKTNNINELEDQIHKIEHAIYPMVVKKIAEGKIGFKNGKVIHR